MSDPVSFHSQLAKSWSSKYRHATFQARMQTFARAIEEFSSPGEHWLDAGCGTGELSTLLLIRGQKISAVDASPDMVRHCAVPSTVATVGHLPFADETFDGIVCSSVLEYTEDPSVGLREFHRVLKPKANLLVSVPNARSVLRAVQRVSYALLQVPQYMEHSHHAFTPEGFDALLATNGFTPRKTKCFGAVATGGGKAALRVLAAVARSDQEVDAQPGRVLLKLLDSCMPTNLYGPNDNYDLQSSLVLPALIRKFHDAIENGQPQVVVWGTGEPRRGFYTATIWPMHASF